MPVPYDAIIKILNSNRIICHDKTTQDSRLQTQDYDSVSLLLVAPSSVKFKEISTCSVAVNLMTI